MYNVRGLSAYMFFANEQRDKVREDNPGIKFGMYSRYSSVVHVLTRMSRRCRQDAGREVEGPEREAACAIRGQGCCRQEALRGGEGSLQRCTLPLFILAPPYYLLTILECRRRGRSLRVSSNQRPHLSERHGRHLTYHADHGLSCSSPVCSSSPTHPAPPCTWIGPHVVVHLVREDGRNQSSLAFAFGVVHLRGGRPWVLYVG